MSRYPPKKFFVQQYPEKGGKTKGMKTDDGQQLPNGAGEGGGRKICYCLTASAHQSICICILFVFAFIFAFVFVSQKYRW